MDVKTRPAPLSTPLREMGYWSVAEAAEVLGLHEVTVRNYVTNGRMDSTRHGNRRVISTRAILGEFADLQRDPDTRDAALARMQRHADALGIVFRHPDEPQVREGDTA